VVITAHPPTEENPIYNEDSFYTSPESVIRSVPPHDKLVVLGDFNAETGCNRIVIGNNNWIFFLYIVTMYTSTLLGRGLVERFAHSSC